MSMRRTTAFRALFLGALLLSASAPAFAADKKKPDAKEPPVPALIENMGKQGAQIRYLGNDYGMDGWITILRGQEQYFYVSPDGKSLMMGLLFDAKTGRAITIDQVKKLQEKEPGLDTLASGQSEPGVQTPPTSAASAAEPDAAGQPQQSPAEQLYAAIESANWIGIGDAKAAPVYVFVDPNCPGCKEFSKELKEKIEAGKLQLRLIPVGFLKEDSLPMAAFLLSAPNPKEIWFRHASGDAKAIPVDASLNTQGVQQNMALMQEWQFQSTPFTVYRNRQGEVKILEGKPVDLSPFLADLP